MIDANFDDINAEHLTELLTQGRREDQTIEYKAQYPTTADSEKVKLLLKPVCSFANTRGGDLVIGLVAENGEPAELVGVETSNSDQDVLRLDSMIRSGIEPQVGGVQIKAVRLGSNRVVFVVRVQKSWMGPHRVTNNRSFYGRGSAGAFELDVPHIRQGFLLSNTAQQEMRRFRENRLGKLLSDESPTPIRAGLSTVLHVLPLQAFVSGRTMSVTEMEPDIQLLAHPRLRSGATWSIGLDGMTIHDVSIDAGSITYTQLFREGQVELVEVFPPDRSDRRLPSAMYELVCRDFVRKAVPFLAARGFGGPMFVGFALLNAKGYRLGISESYEFMSGQKTREFDRDVLIFPIVELSERLEAIDHDLRPIFDHVWNAGGIARSLNYDDEGNWTAYRG